MFAFGKSVLDCLSISFVQVRKVCLNLCRLLGGVYLVTCCLIMSVLGSIGFHQNNNDNATKLPCSLSTLSISGWWVWWFDAHPILSSPCLGWCLHHWPERLSSTRLVLGRIWKYGFVWIIMVYQNTHGLKPHFGQFKRIELQILWIIPKFQSHHDDDTAGPKRGARAFDASQTPIAGRSLAAHVVSICFHVFFAL